MQDETKSLMSYDSEVFAPSMMKDRSPSLSAINATPSTINHWSSPEAMAVAFGENKKAQIAARAMFELVHQFGDNLREGWKNVLDLLLHLLRSNLLPPQMVHLEDFVDPRGHISLKERFKRRQPTPKKEESGLFSWLGFGSGSSGANEFDQKGPTEEEKELCKHATNIIVECHPEQLVPDSRYLATSALTELINNIIHSSMAIAQMPPPHQQTPQQQHDDGGGGHAIRQQHESQGSQDDDSIVDLSAAAALLPGGPHSPPSPTKDAPIGRQNDDDNNEQHNYHHAQLGPTNSHHSTHSSSKTSSEVHDGPHHQQQHSPIKLSMGEEEELIFLLELMVGIVLENRDRLAQVWSLIRDHLRWLLTQFPQNQQLMERAVVAIIRIANRNLFRLGQQQQSSSPSPLLMPAMQSEQQQQISNQPKRHQPMGLISTKSVVIVVDEDEQQQREEKEKPAEAAHLDHQTIQQKTSYCADEVLQFMGRQLTSLRPPELFLFSRQIAFGLQVLLRANAANVHSSEHWKIFFDLLEAIGAAAYQEDDFNFVEHNKQWALQSSHQPKNSKKCHQQSAPRDAAQSDPEGKAAAPPNHQQQMVDERGYCSDDPSSSIGGPSAESGPGREQQHGRKRAENPLLTAPMEHRAAGGQVRILNKAESGEWIHVVPTPMTVPLLAQPKIDDETGHLMKQEQVVNESDRAPHFTPLTPIEQTPLGPVLHQTPLAQLAPPSIPPPIPAGISPAAISAGIYVPVLPMAFPGHQNSALATQPIEVAAEATEPMPPSQPPPPPVHPRAACFKRGTIVLAPNLSRHDPAAFLKVVETLTFLARDAAHITPANFNQFTHCLRMMVEASMDGGKCAPVQLPVSSIPSSSSSPAHSGSHQASTTASKQFPVPHENEQQKLMKQQKTEKEEGGGEKISEQERLANCYMDASLQLLNICAQMHALAADIYRDWAEDDAAANEQRHQPNAMTTEQHWSKHWRPLLQAMARMSCDCRRRIRAQALDALGSAFRVPALSEFMRPSDWEDCFAEVLFPLLTRLLSSPPISPMDPIGMEEARIRAIQLTCKILLGHLTQISRLETFADLLRRLFDQMDQYLEGNACSDLLAEVIQESLKNCVLVCESFGIFQGPLGGLHGEMNDRLEGLAKKHCAGLKLAL